MLQQVQNHYGWNIGNMHKGGIIITDKDKLKEDNDRKKEWLNGYRRFERKIKSLNEQREQIRCEKMQAKSQVITDMPRSGRQSDTSDYIARLEEIEKDIADATRMMYLRRLKIEKAIILIEDGIQADILRSRYINGMEWEDICVAIGYSWRQTHRYHSEALSNIKVS